MKHKPNAFKILFFKELNKQFWRLFGVAFLGFALPFLAYAFAGATKGLNAAFAFAEYSKNWTLNAQVAVYLICAILPAYALADERGRGGDALKRFPVSTQAVVFAKISAVLTFCVAVCLFCVVSSYAIDVCYGLPVSSTLTRLFVDASGIPRVSLVFRRLLPVAFASFELLCWGVFWGARIRRGTLAAIAGFASSCCVWLFLAVLFDWNMRHDLTTSSPIFAPFISVHAGVYGRLFQHDFYTVSRSLFCLVPLYGIYRQCRRNGATTAFSLPT